MNKKISLWLLILTMNTIHPKVILWDLGGVLFEPDKIGVAQAIGLSYFASHSFWDMRSPTTIQKVLFDVLSLLEKPFEENTGIAGSARGMPLPTIMCRWQAGTITGKEISERAYVLIDKLYDYDYFDSKGQMVLVKRCMKYMFDPETLANNVYPVEAGIQLLSESSALRDEKGKKVHRQFVFSNWDHLSYDICYKKHKRVFHYFEQIVISGHIKLIKPHKDSFDYIIKKYDLDPAECILIDDQESNARTARNCGMKAVLIREGNYEALRDDLKRLGVL